MLARGALLRSGRAGDAAAAKCVEELLEVAGKRKYLRVPAYMFIVDAIMDEQVRRTQGAAAKWLSV